MSVTVITLNEAAHLEAALESVRWADEIVVVDSGSTDGTVDIAKRFTSNVVVREWPGYSAQKQFASTLASHYWILSIDADERVSVPTLTSCDQKLGLKNLSVWPQAVSC